MFGCTIYCGSISSSWFLYISKSDSLCTIGVKTGVYRKGIETMIEVHIDKDNNVSVQFGNAMIVPNQLGLPPNLTKCSLNFCEYLAKLQLCHLCMGKMCVESWPDCQLYMQDGGLHYVIHTISCFGMLTLLSSGYTCTRCHSIQLKKWSPKTHSATSHHLYGGYATPGGVSKSKVCTAVTSGRQVGSGVHLHSREFVHIIWWPMGKIYGTIFPQW